MPDLRDETTWVTLELTRSGEQLVAEGLLDRQIRRDLGVEDDHPIFIPSVIMDRGGTRTSYHLMEGYVFVASGLSEVQYFALESKHYVEQVMSTRQGPHRMRTLHTIPNSKIQQMRRNLVEMVTSGIGAGTHVRICEGQYRNLDGKVIGVEDSNAHVRVTLRSLDMVATVPRIFLEELPEEE